MKHNQFLKRMSRLNPEMRDKYGMLTDVWWRTPQEDYLSADMYSRAYFGVGIISWVFTSISLFLSLLAWTSQSSTSLIIGLTFSLALGVVGLNYMTKSSRYKKKAQDELKLYKKSVHLKRVTERKLKETSLSVQHELHQTLNKGLEDAQDFKQIIHFLSQMSWISKEGLEDVKSIYGEGKTYDYNVNEAKEIEAFQEVDSFKVYDDIYHHLYQIIDQINRCKEAAEKEQPQEFQYQTDRLIELLPDVSELLNSYSVHR